METIRYLLSALKGTPQARNGHRQVLLSKPDIESGVRRLATLCPADEQDIEEPVFLLSAGWRSGSTLLQRLVMSDPDVFIWGEPYDHCGIIQALAETTRAFTDDWPPEDYYYDGTPGSELSDRWIADMYPDLRHLWLGHRAIFKTLFSEPAKSAGAVRWGLKEVRLGIEHAIYLQWLFPRARFLFLYRNPLNAYQSYCRYGRSWYKNWPDAPVHTPAAFGRHWRELTQGFIGASEKVNGLVVRYEDLSGEKGLIHDIEQHLDIQVDSTTLERKVGSSEHKGEKPWVSRLEKWMLRRAVSPQAAELGYRW